MKNLALFVIIQIFMLQAYCQNTYPEVLSAAGGTLSNPQYLVDWTLGEPVIETVYGANSILTQGFHQSNFFTISIQELPGFEITVYPNPASSVIMISTTSQQPVSANLYDLNGKLLKEQHFIENTEINISDIARSVYLLKITNQNKHTIKITRIIKIR